MKVLQINAVYNYSSTGRSTTELHNALKHKGVESFVVCSRIYNSNDEVYRMGSECEIKYHGLMSRVFGKQGCFSKNSTKKMLKYIDSIKPDIVHLRNLHSNYINFPILLSYLAENGIATVVTLHDCWFFTGKCMHYTNDNCYKWQTGCGNCKKLRRDNKSYFFDRTSQMWSDKKRLFESIPRLAVIGVSDWITNEGRKSILASAKIIRRIYNWVDTKKFHPVDSHQLKIEMNLNNKFIILGIASIWSNEKGLSKFIELSNVLDDDECIMLIGNIDDTIKLPDNIINIKAINDVSKLVQYISIGDVFIQLSTEETFGKVVVEAMACGLPVITNKFTANPELVNNSVGTVIDEISINSIKNAINSIKANGKNYYSEKCREFAVQNFTMDYCIDQYYELYKELINK